MSKKQQLLDLAMEKVRQGGYGHFSFRELAKEVGIKSASVHYHFPTKEDMGAELARQYTDSFLDALGNPQELVAQGVDPIVRYGEQFRQALIKDRQMCLCGLLGAELDGLPAKVQQETQSFFQRNIQWLEQAYQAKAPLMNLQQRQDKAIFTLSLLEGAMMVSRNLQNFDAFDSIISQLQ